MSTRDRFIDALAEKIKTHLHQFKDGSPIDEAAYSSGIRDGVQLVLDLTSDQSREEGFRIFEVELKPVGKPVRQFDEYDIERQPSKPYHPLITDLWNEVNS